jgi:hypothetical protein
MLGVANKSIMLNVIILSVVMLSVIMLNVVPPSIMDRQGISLHLSRIKTHLLIVQNGKLRQ